MIVQTGQASSVEGKRLLPVLCRSDTKYKMRLSVSALGGGGMQHASSELVTASGQNCFVKLSVSSQHVVHVKRFAGLVSASPWSL